MRFDRAIRLPLQIGTSSLWSLAWASATLVPAAILLVATALGALLGLGLLLLSDLGLFVLGVVVAEGMAIAWGVRHLRRAWRSRPSDVILAAEGIRIEGGPSAGRSLRWEELDGQRCQLREKSDGGDKVWQLRLAGKKGAPFLVAEAELDDERASLETLLESIKGQDAPAGADPPSAAPDLLRCPECDAPAAPDDAEQVRCSSCGKPVPVPATLRARLRAARETGAARQRAAGLVKKLLDQPGARSTNVLYLVAALPTLLAWLVALAVALWLRAHGALELLNGLLLVVFALGTVFSCFAFVRLRLANRVALRLLTLHFGARPPATPEAPYGCRECAAPLAARAGELLVKCVYCGADNVLGVDPRPRHAGAHEQAWSLGDALRRRRSERAGWALRATLALGILPVSGIALRVAARPLSSGARLAMACSKGDAASCLAVGRIDLLEKGCAAGDLAGCLALAQAKRSGRGTDEDLPGAGALARRACDGGLLFGCTIAGELGSDEGLLRKACDGDEPHACADLGDFDKACRLGDRYGCARFGKQTFAEDPARARAWFEKGCNADEPIYLACFYLGEVYLDGKGVARSNGRAFDLFRRACEYGSVGPACTHVGLFQENRKDLKNALYHYEIACAYGDGQGCEYAGMALYDGGEPDKALNVYRKGCEIGFGHACYQVGWMLRKGKGVSHADDQALVAYDRGCGLGDLSSCNVQGMLVEEQAPARARELYTRACDGGNANACDNLGVLYQTGKGVAVDLERAKELYRKACDGGTDAACDNLCELGESARCKE